MAPGISRKSNPARLRLGVLVSPERAKKGLKVEECLEEWQDKFRELVARLEKEPRGKSQVQAALPGLDPVDQLKPGQELKEQRELSLAESLQSL